MDSDEDIPLLEPVSLIQSLPKPAAQAPDARPPAASAGEGDADASDLPTVPVTILSGFLGSGKTTLLQYVLAAAHGLRIAVIVNEFEFGRSIEKGLTVRSAEAADDDEWVQLENGCMCCSAKSQSVQALEQLVKRRRGAIDLILVEAAGMADPAPIAASFWLDPQLQSCIRLAGVVTVVDALRIEAYLGVGPVRVPLPAAGTSADGADQSEQSQQAQQQRQGQAEPCEKYVEATQQLLVADRVLLNKIDLLMPPGALPSAAKLLGAGWEPTGAAEAAALHEVLAAVRSVNPVAAASLVSLRALHEWTKTASPAELEAQSARLREWLLLDGAGSFDASRFVPPPPPAVVEHPPCCDHAHHECTAHGDCPHHDHADHNCSHSHSHCDHHNHHDGHSDRHHAHVHTQGVTAHSVEVAGRLFESKASIDALYAAILYADDATDVGLTENYSEGAQLPHVRRELISAGIVAAADAAEADAAAEAAAHQQRAALRAVVRSKSALWVRNAGTGIHHNMKAPAALYQAQSVGRMFDVVPMAGANAALEATGSTELPVGVNRLLVLGRNWTHAALETLVEQHTVPFS